MPSIIANGLLFKKYSNNALYQQIRYANLFV